MDHEHDLYEERIVLDPAELQEMLEEEYLEDEPDFEAGGEE